MDEELKEQVLELLANSLTIDIDTKSEYVGGMDGGPLYKDYHTVKLILDGEVISRVSF